jgi:virulence-associated protein VapD
MLQKGPKPSLAPRLGLDHNSTIFRREVGEGARVYAICFDLDQESLRRHYPAATHTNAYEDISRCLEAFGFTRQQGSVYFGNANVTPVTCVMAVQDLQRRHSWFGKVVSDLRMLRIDEHNDLLPAIAQLDIQFPSLD